MTYHSLLYKPVVLASHGPELSAFLEQLITTIETAPLPRRKAGNKKLGPDTEKAMKPALQNGFSGTKTAWIHDREPISAHHNDRPDFFTHLTLDGQPWVCIIEADPTRGDAIAKKFVSRVACVSDASLINASLIYVTLCFEGTQQGTIYESKKYMEFCANISQNLSLPNKQFVYLGFMPDL